MQATEIERSAPTIPSLSVTTRRRFTPRERRARSVCGDAAVALDAALGVTNKLHSCHDVLSQAFTTWQTVVLVSCIIVTESYPYVVAVLTASARTIGAAPSGYFSSGSLPCHQPEKWNGMNVVPGPTRSVTIALTLICEPVAALTQT